MKLKKIAHHCCRYCAAAAAVTLFNTDNKMNITETPKQTRGINFVFKKE